ncbi:MAG: MBL fold metallo-hydrolase [Actinobacteria bacterium]|nr:MBL fold metallo-hydrolase [Actinomycetota bacterium]
MRELQRGLWHWTAVHPEWEPGTDWAHTSVSSYALDDGAQLLLFDPIAVPSELIARASEREVAIVLTCPWHERDSQALVDELRAPIFLPPPEAFNDDVDWLRPDLERLEAEGRIFVAGDRLPIGVDAFAGKKACDLVLWVEGRNALVIGDTLLDRGNGLELLTDWLSAGQTRDQLIEILRPLLDLPIEVVLPTHGPPTDKAALGRALASRPD